MQNPLLKQIKEDFAGHKSVNLIFMLLLNQHQQIRFGLIFQQSGLRFSFNSFVGSVVFVFMSKLYSKKNSGKKSQQKCGRKH